jgi:hypothetical protein
VPSLMARGSDLVFFLGVKRFTIGRDFRWHPPKRATGQVFGCSEDRSGPISARNTKARPWRRPGGPAGI